MFESAFNQIISLRQRVVTFERYDKVTGIPVTYTLNVSPSSFQKQDQSIEEVSIEAREYVISVLNLSKAGIPLPLKRGDNIIDVDTDVNTITEVRELTGLGGGIIGYRVRTS